MPLPAAAGGCARLDEVGAGFPRGAWRDPPQRLGGTAASCPRGAWRVGVDAGRCGRPGLLSARCGRWGAGAHLCLLVGRGELLPPVWVEPPHLPGGRSTPSWPPSTHLGGACVP